MAYSTLRNVFVYGTLKCGEPNHSWLSDSDNGYAKFIGQGSTTQSFPLIIGTRYNIPFLLNRPGTGNIVNGEIYEIDDKMLAQLDFLEGYPDFYDREIQEIKLLENTEYSRNIPCWVYILKRFPDHLLNFKMLTEYKNTPEKRYLERSRRIENISAKDDLGYQH